MASSATDNQVLEMADILAALSNEHRPAGTDKIRSRKVHHMVCNALRETHPSVLERVKALTKIQEAHSEVEAEFNKEMAALEAKYRERYQPLFDKRYEIVNGLVEVEGLNVEDQVEGEEKVNGIPGFWLKALSNNTIVGAEITENDEDALLYLSDIRWTKTEGRKGFKLEFRFDENPYFKNSVLTKTYYMIDEEEPTLGEAIGTKIDWLPERRLGLDIKEDDDIVSKVRDRVSFFDFFATLKAPAHGTIIDGITINKLKELMEDDYEMGAEIRNKIVPYAFLWFTGAAVEDDFDIDSDDDDSDEDSDDEDYLDDSDDYDYKETAVKEKGETSGKP